MDGVIEAVRSWWNGRGHVYVLTATDGEQVKECVVVTDLDEAQRVRGVLKHAYGGASVYMASRRVNDVPDWITRTQNWLKFKRA